MGYPTFYLYHEDSSPLTVVSFGRPISDVYMTPSRVRVDAIGGDGGVVSRLGPATSTVTIRREKCTDATLVRSWRNVEEHLLRGRRVGFSWDHAKTWAAYGTGGLAVAQTIAYTFGNAFSPWSSSATLAGGDEVVIEESNPSGRRQYAAVSSVTSGQVMLSAGSLLDMSGWMLRYARFWPALYLPDDLIPRARILSDRGLLFGLDLTLAVDPGILAYGGPWSGTPGGPDLGLRTSTAAKASAGRSLDELLTSRGPRVSRSLPSAYARGWSG